jgi:hypothetical protein
MKLGIVATPMTLVVPAPIGETNPQPRDLEDTDARSCVCPGLACLLDSARYSAFFGLLRKCTVSCQPVNSSYDRITMLPLPPWRVTTSGSRVSATRSRWLDKCWRRSVNVMTPIGMLSRLLPSYDHRAGASQRRMKQGLGKPTGSCQPSCPQPPVPSP